MSAIKENLFTEVSSEESSYIAGGSRTHHGGGGYPSPSPAGYPVQVGSVLNFNLNKYLFGIGAGVAFGNAGLTADEVQFSWENAIEYGPTIASIP